MGEKCTVELDIKTVLEQFSNNIAKAREKFSEFVHDGINKADTINLYPAEKFPVIGDKKFLEHINKKYKELRREVKTGLRMSIQELATKLSHRFKLEVEELELATRGKEISHFRAVFCYLGNLYCGHKVVDLARYLRKDPSAVTHAIRRIKENVRINEIEELIGKLR